MGVITPSENPGYTWWVRLMIAMQKRRLGKPLQPTVYWGRIPRAFFGFLWMLRAFNRKKSPFTNTSCALIRVYISQLLHCRFCIDLNMSDALNIGLSQEKLEALTGYQTHALYNDEERLLLHYAKAVVQSDTPSCVALQSRLQKIFSGDAIIELTGLITHQAMSAMFNCALGIDPHGFCQVRGKE